MTLSKFTGKHTITLAGLRVHAHHFTLVYREYKIVVLGSYVGILEVLVCQMIQLLNFFQ